MIMNEADGQPYRDLGPEDILRAVEEAGFSCDGRILALNSYENRVYQLGIEDSAPLVVKFYRPGRWSDAAIREEHAFTWELQEREIPAVAPLRGAQGETLFHHGRYRFALFPCRGGRPPELDDPEQLEILGRFIGRLHGVGAVRPFQHRPTLDVEHFAVESYQYLLEQGFMPPELAAEYRSLAETLVKGIRERYRQAGNVAYLRIHGDCHPGNILWAGEGPFIVDFDDVRMGPAVQDLWMFLSGERDYMTARLHDLLAGYSVFRHFERRELHLVEALRTMRMMHYAAWLARRWDDPAFPQAFPWFNSRRYWEEHVVSLREQVGALEAPPLSCF